MSTLLDRVDWPVRTERLTLRRATVHDAATTWTYRSLPEVGAWITSAPDDFATYLEQFTDEKSLALTLVIEREGIVIGDLMVHVRDAWSQREVREQAVGAEAELGWSLAPGHQGQGYATEAVRATISLCFAQLGVRRVVAECFADNEPSWRLMERLGMRREGHAVRDSLHRSGEWLDGLTYAVLREEWTG